ncbi:MAG: hypothetical protein JKY66_10360 [Spongiibacteraceae bacterium]|nr:hypothetical protein [Spongiibacteraceae bacterium]
MIFRKTKHNIVCAYLKQVLGLGITIACTVFSNVGVAQTTLYEHNFTSGLGDFSSSGRVTTGSYGMRLRGGSSTAQITSNAIDISGATDISLRFTRTTSGLDTGEQASASYSLDGFNYTTLESVQSASGSVSYPIPEGSTSLYLKYTLEASSYFETYTMTTVTIEADSSNPGGPEDCSGSSLSPGETTRTVSVNGVRRQYILSIPRSYNSNQATSLVLDFHPLLNDADYQLDNSGTQSLSEQEGFIVAYPDGIDNAWNFGPCCTESRSVDDIGFARKVIEDISANTCVDRKRVYAMGYSNGGGMAYHLACNATDLVAAVAPAAFDLVEEMTCNPSRPVSVYIKRGRLDFIVPYSGGRSTPPVSYNLDPIHFLGAEGTFEAWADFNSCSGQPSSAGSSCEIYDSCASGTEVLLCTERFGSHSGWDAEDAWNYLKTQTIP